MKNDNYHFIIPPLENNSSPLHGSTIAKITLSKILKMPLVKYVTFIERKINEEEDHKGKHLSFYAKVIPANGDLKFSDKDGCAYDVEISDERLLKRYPICECIPSGNATNNNEVVVKMINTRNEFSEHIVRGILTIQRKFWETEEELDIKPLTFRQFLSLFPFPKLDESRLSRLVSVLTLQTQGGKIVNLRMLFSSRRRSFATVIKGIIDEFDEALTDKDIQTVLREQYDIHLSARAICECRKLLSIPNFRERRACYYPKSISFSKPIAMISSRQSAVGKRINRIPAEPGVYELRLSSKIPYPQCSSHVIYIGSSKNLRRRTANYTGNVLKNKRIAGYLRNDNVCIHYYVTTDHIKLEKELLRNFKQHYGQLPKGNIIGAKL
jgi:hypothetical protein